MARGKRKPKQGIHKDVPFHHYKEWEAMNFSSLKHLVDKTPAHFQHEITKEKKVSSAMRKGSALDTLVFEPEKFDVLYGVKKENWSTKAGKAEKEELLKSYHPNDIITKEEYVAAQCMRDSVTAHPAASHLLSKVSITQPSLFWIHDGIPMKGRPDAIIEGNQMVLDLKSSESANRAKFGKKAKQLHYQLQGAVYLTGLKRLGFATSHYMLIVVENTEPYLTATYRMAAKDIADGEKKFTYLINKYRDVLESGVYHGYSDKIEELELPEWN